MVCGLLKWEGKLVGGVWFAWEMRWKLSVVADEKTNG